MNKQTSHDMVSLNKTLLRILLLLHWIIPVSYILLVCVLHHRNKLHYVYLHVNNRMIAKYHVQRAWDEIITIPSAVLEDPELERDVERGGICCAWDDMINISSTFLEPELERDVERDGAGDDSTLWIAFSAIANDKLVIFSLAGFFRGIWVPELLLMTDCDCLGSVMVRKSVFTLIAPSFVVITSWCFSGCVVIWDTFDSTTSKCTGDGVFDRWNICLNSSLFQNGLLLGDTFCLSSLIFWSIFSIQKPRQIVLILVTSEYSCKP